jgi:hypothetical protein
VLVLGLLVINGGSGRTLTKAEQRQYDAILNSIDLQAEFDATEQYRMALWRYQSTKGWFWSCDSLCQRHKRQMERAKQTLDAIRAEGNARMRDAKRIAGLSSDIAVQEMIDSFWQYFAAGKQFAKRQTGWDIMWMTIRSMTTPRGRDEAWAEYIIKILMHVLINFTMGLLSALVFFVLGLWNILKSYQPNPIVAVLVFLAAASAASTFVATYSKSNGAVSGVLCCLFLFCLVSHSIWNSDSFFSSFLKLLVMALFGAAAGGLYGMAKLAETSARQRIAADQRRQRLHYD